MAAAQGPILCQKGQFWEIFGFLGGAVVGGLGDIRAILEEFHIEIGLTEHKQKGEDDKKK